MKSLAGWVVLIMAVALPLTVLAQPVGPSLPPGATVERACLPGLGYLAYLGRDMPFGPYYGVYQNKLIFTEYKATLDEAQRGKLANLKSMSGPVDNVDVVWRPRGHQGFDVPHFDVFLWNIPQAERQAIRCP